MAITANDLVKYSAHQRAIAPVGGQTMIFEFADGTYLIRFLVPSSPGVRAGKYSEGYSTSFAAALEQAAAGLLS